MLDEDKTIEKLEEKANKISEELGDYQYGQYEEQLRSNEDSGDDFSEDKLSYDQTLIRDYKKLTDEIERLKRKQQIAKDKKNYKESENAYIMGNTHSDKETSIDKLNREIYINPICKLITNLQVESPLTIGIFGEWGKGKSSFLKLIEQKLEELFKNNKDNNTDYCNTHIVQFDASEYNEEEKIWYSLLNQIFIEYQKDKPVRNMFSLAFRKFKNTFKHNLLKYIVKFIIPVLFLIFLIFKFGFFVVMKYIIYIITLFLTGNLLVSITKKISSIIKPLSDKINSSFEEIEYSKHLGSRPNIKNDIKEIIDLWLEKDSNGDYCERLVILVDELDRCSEKTIVEFFKALNLILPIEGIVVILAINYKSVCYALANNNQHYFDLDTNNKQKIKFGVKYLDKYINIPFHIPHEVDYEKYIKQLLKLDEEITIKKELGQVGQTLEKSTNEKITFSQEENELIKKTLLKTSKIVNLTPRDMKKIVNMLTISKDIWFTYNKEQEENIPFTKYILWFIFAFFNPETSYNVANISLERSRIFAKKDLKNDKHAIKFYDHLRGLGNLYLYEIKILQSIAECFLIDLEKILINE